MSARDVSAIESYARECAKAVGVPPNIVSIEHDGHACRVGDYCGVSLDTADGGLNSYVKMRIREALGLYLTRAINA